MVVIRSQGYVRALVQIDRKTTIGWARFTCVRMPADCGYADPASVSSCRLRLLVGITKRTAVGNPGPFCCKPVSPDIRNSAWNVDLARNRYRRCRGHRTRES